MEVDEELTSGPEDAVALAEHLPRPAEMLDGIDGVHEIDARIRQRNRRCRRLHERDVRILLGADANDLRVVLDPNGRERLGAEESVEDVSLRAPELSDDLVAKHDEVREQSAVVLDLARAIGHVGRGVGVALGRLVAQRIAA